MPETPRYKESVERIKEGRIKEANQRNNEAMREANRNSGHNEANRRRKKAKKQSIWDIIFG